MNRQSKALLASLAIHSGLICFAITLSISQAHLQKPVVIDFSILDGASGPKSSGPAKATGKSPEKASPERKPQVAEKPVPAKPQVVQTVHAPVPAAMVPVSEPMAAVPVSAAPGDSAANHEPKSNGIGTEARQGQSVSANGSGSGNVRSASANGAGNSSEQMRSRYMKEQFEYIKKLIEKSITYPARAKRMGLTGRVLISFSILENGYIANVKIANSSGYELLDENVLETVRRVQPFPKPPVRAELKIPITYRLD
jgi:periplasmic protein TonB